jgi:integrase
MPTWVKVAIDAWMLAADVADDHVFRSVNRADRVTGERLGEKVVWQLIKPYAGAAGVPGIAPHDLRRTCAKLCRAGGGELEQIQCCWVTLLCRPRSGISARNRIWSTLKTMRSN